MKPLWLLILGSVVVLISSCNSNVSTKPDDYVGEYVLAPRNTNPGDLPSFIVLAKDNTATEIRTLIGTSRVVAVQTRWYLSHSTGENVVIGDYSHPIEHSGGAIRLIINDVGQFYEKVR